MRKKTGVALVLGIIGTIATIGAAYVFRTGFGGQAFVHNVGFFGGIGALGLAGVSLAITFAVVVEGIIKRSSKRHNIRKSSKQIALVKDKSKTYRFSKRMAKDFCYLVSNKKPTLFGKRKEDLNSKKINEATAQAYKYGILGHDSRRVEKKYNKAVNKIKNTGNVGTVYGVVTINQNMELVGSERQYPALGEKNIYDHRNEILCFSSKARDAYFALSTQFTDSYSAEKNSSGKTTFKDEGYKTTVNFANKGLPSVYVKSSAEKNMDDYELILLKDVAVKIKSEGVESSVFPLEIEKVHNGTKENSTKRIASMDALEERIDLLKRYSANSKSVKATHDHYAYTDYSRTTIPDPAFDKEEEYGK